LNKLNLWSRRYWIGENLGDCIVLSVVGLNWIKHMEFKGL